MYIEHEATVSKVNEEQLFYLMSRGLTEAEATEEIKILMVEDMLLFLLNYQKAVIL